MASVNIQRQKVKESKVTAEMVRSYFTYDDLSGELRHARGGGRRIQGGLVGWRRKDGYFDTNVNGCRFLLHRVIWLFSHGEWPNGFVDHINGNRDDNRISNLRVVTATGNGMNRQFATGYCRHTQNDSWVISLGGAYGGTTKTEKEAIKIASYLKDAVQMWLSFTSVRKRM